MKKPDFGLCKQEYWGRIFCVYGQFFFAEKRRKKIQICAIFSFDFEDDCFCH